MYFPIILCKMKRPLVGPFLADFIVMHKLNKPYPKDATYGISLYLEYWFTRRRALNVFPYLTLCKIQHPYIAIFMDLFLIAMFTNHVLRMLYVKYRVFGKPVHEKIFKKITKYYPFLPFIYPF